MAKKPLLLAKNHSIRQKPLHLAKKHTFLAKKTPFWLETHLFGKKNTILARNASLARERHARLNTDSQPGMSGCIRNDTDSGFPEHPVGVNFAKTDIPARTPCTPRGGPGTAPVHAEWWWGVVVPRVWGTGTWCGPWCGTVVWVRAGSCTASPL